MWAEEGAETFADFAGRQFDADFAAAGHGAAWAVEHGWAPQKCDPCTGAGPLDDPDAHRVGWPHSAQEAFFTRLHLRTTPEAAVEDLTRYFSGVETQDQQRFIRYSKELESDFPICGQGWVTDDPGTCAQDDRRAAPERTSLTRIFRARPPPRSRQRARLPALDPPGGPSMRKWTTADSAELYGIPNWGREFLKINDHGHLTVAPAGSGGLSLDLKALVDDLQRRDIGLPILVRFTDLLKNRIDTLSGAFHKAIAEYAYQGQYRGVYPVKVNQQRHLVEEIVNLGAEHHLGLECGSKPELLVVMAMLQDPEALIVCNGYKDEEYVETAMLAQKLGRRTIIVIEKASEIGLCVQVAKRLGVKPYLGFRAKLASKGAGRWEASTGDKAKFGLTIAEMVAGVEQLAASDMLDTLRLLHFHIGSQVSNIRSFKEALKEGSRIYVELAKMGAPMGYFDAGGGLGVDYDGSSTNFASSMNYTVEEYALDVIGAVASSCDEYGVAHPNIVTESGRAMVAHHAALIVNVLGVSEHPTGGDATAPTEDDPEVLHELYEALTDCTRKKYQAAWHDALAARAQALNMFNLGLLDLRQRARAEHLFWQIAGRIGRIISDLDYVPDELGGLKRALADTYFCNFSVFQSMPDAWAVDQLFPVIPIHRLNEEPTRTGILADITCDSDGKLDKFIDLHDVADTLRLHPLGEEPYYLGAFLVGAYQEILGDLHNLFGDTNTVMVSIHEDGSYELDSVVEGDTVTEVLKYVQYDRRQMVQRLRRACEKAVKNGNLSIEDSARLMKGYIAGLEGYTYLE